MSFWRWYGQSLLNLRSPGRSSLVTAVPALRLRGSAPAVPLGPLYSRSERASRTDDLEPIRQRAGGLDESCRTVLSTRAQP